MKLAISNIAWAVEQDALVAAMLERQGVRAIEIAPTKIWPNPLEVSPAEVSAYRRTWEIRGMRIVAAQSLLFGRPELIIFSDETTRRRTLAYLEAMIGLCADLGAEALVFGSPRNRRCNELAADLVEKIAVDFFGALGESAFRRGTAVVMEANPQQYGADFVTRAAEAISLVQKVNNFGFRLHLDTACMTLADDPIDESLTAGAAWLHHFHVSEPSLAPIGTGEVDHPKFAQALKAVGYDRWCSIEMKLVEPFQVEDLEHAITVAKRYYASLAIPS
jgi:D-psicose/D-tagatose/L-ribulose 3-epimerase